MRSHQSPHPGPWGQKTQQQEVAAWPVLRGERVVQRGSVRAEPKKIGPLRNFILVVKQYRKTNFLTNKKKYKI